MSATGALYGVGVGPGDPELMTVRAVRVIQAVDVVAFHVARHGRSVARTIAQDLLRPEQIELALEYPVTTEETDHAGGYDGALAEFYDRGAESIAQHLDAGSDVAVLCEGDPLFYGSYMYLHERLAQRYPTVVIPGVTSVSAAAAAAGVPIARRDDVLAILPGTLPESALAEWVGRSDAAVVMKLGRTFPGVRGAIDRAGASERSIYVERASSARESVQPLERVRGDVPYMSLVLVPPQPQAGRPRERDAGREGRVAVIGLGPGDPDWTTPEARAELDRADVLVGYGPYLARVPRRSGQERIASDNREELERARQALELARDGRAVGIVSSGDPGVYAMASAVFEQIERTPDRFGDVAVQVVPGVSAMQAVAARAGAPLGHDFCVISLSDLRKPWTVIERRLAAAAEADMAIAIYNPASRSRREQLEQARQVLLRHRAQDTPVVIGRAVGTPDETVALTTLGAFPADAVDMRTMLIVGASTTRSTGLNGKRYVYTPRTYTP